MPYLLAARTFKHDKKDSLVCVLMVLSAHCTGQITTGGGEDKAKAD